MGSRVFPVTTAAAADLVTLRGWVAARKLK